MVDGVEGGRGTKSKTTAGRTRNAERLKSVSRVPRDQRKIIQIIPKSSIKIRMGKRKRRQKTEKEGEVELEKQVLPQV